MTSYASGLEDSSDLKDTDPQFFSRQMADAMPQLVWTARADGTVDYYNARYREYDGIGPGADGTWIWDPVLHPDDVEVTVEAWTHAVEHGVPYECEHRVRMIDGSFRWHISRAYPTRDTDGRVIRWYGTATDIHRSRQAEEALRQSERRYASIFENNHSVMLVVDPETSAIVDANPAACAYYGYTKKELVSKQIGDINLLSDRDIAEEMNRARRSNIGPFTFRHRLASGEVRDVDVYSGPIQFSEKTYLFSIIHDVTDRRQAMEALQESEYRYRSLVEQASDGIYLVSADGTIAEINTHACEMLGYTHEELLRMNLTEIITHQNLLEKPLTLQEVLHNNGGILRFERVYRRKDGSTFPVEISTRQVGPDLVQGIFRDITDRKQAVQLLKDINVQLERLVRERTAELENRNQELQSFAFVASHDLQEPLRKIQTFAGMMMTESLPGLDESGAFYLERINSAAIRMQKLLNEVLVYTRIVSEGNEFRLVNVGTVLREILSDVDLLLAETGADIAVDADVEVEADPGQLRQLLNHLVINALKFRKPDVRPSIRIVAEMEPERMYRITIEDNGIGFDPKYAERIFSPFQQLNKSRYEGTGMGLAICKRIVDRHGGTITAESSPGRGSRFIVTFPG